MFLLNFCGCAKATTNATQTEMNSMNKVEELSGTFTTVLIKNNSPKVDGITLNFKENVVTGHSGCNRYSGSYKQKGNSLTISNVITTKMYCKNASETERLFLECLSNTKSFTLERGTLLLRTDEVVLLSAEKKSEKQANDEVLVIYDSHTRGYHFTATVYDTHITVVKEYNGTPQRLEVKPEDVEALKEIISGMTLENINKYEAPTKKRHYDGAPHTSITVFRNNEKFSSQVFDGGFPPEALTELVNKVLSLSAEK